MLQWTGIATIAALIAYFIFSLNVGRARQKYNVPAPQMTGDPNFERVLRVHQNTLEQLVIFLPALWMFSLSVSAFWGAVGGAVWVIGRILYARGYYQAADKRGPGFAISMAATMTLLLGSLVGMIRTLL